MSSSLVQPASMDESAPSQPCSGQRSFYYGWIMLPLAMAALSCFPWHGCCSAIARSRSASRSTGWMFVANTPAQALVAGVALGISQGIYFGATHPLWARYFGRRHLGRIRGTLMTITVSSSSLGPLLAGLTRDWQGSFTLALILFAITPLPIAVLSLLVSSPRACSQCHLV